MKHWVIALLTVAALLTGCQVQTQPPETTQIPEESTEATEPLPSCYVENSPMERGTGGAVKLYQLEQSVTGMGMLGDHLLLCLDGDTLALLDGQSLQVLRTRQLEQKIQWNQAGVVLGENGIGYYDRSSSSYVTLDSYLLPLSTYEIPEHIVGQCVISQDFGDIYYATTEGIRVMHLAEGTSRLLREEHNTVLSVGGLLFDDEALYYTRKTSDGTVQTCFINAENGSLYQAADFQGQICSWGKQYAGLMTLDHAMGQCKWLVTGDLSGTLQRLDSAYAWTDAILLDNNRVILQQSNQVGLTLYCYDLTTGALLAQVIMPQQYTLLTMGCTDGNRIWLCDGAMTRFYCWDTTVGNRGTEDSALVEYTSLDAPDEEGFAQCRLLAQVIGGRYGVEITIQEENNRTAGVDYSGYPDFRPDLYNQALRELERVLKTLPDQFLKKVGQRCDQGKLEICLVDDYDPGTKVSQATGSIDVTGGNGTIKISMCRNIQEIFYHELFHMLEVQMMNATDGFQEWDKLNPEGFAYVNSYASYEAGELRSSDYLTWGENSFADDYGMVSAREDRAQIFLYACLDDQQERFAAPAIQEKLERVCQMIRKCYGLSADASLLWEQYLLPEEVPEQTPEE